MMFPGGSPDLVEPIYKNLKLSAPFNEQLAAAVRLYVEARLRVLLPPQPHHVFSHWVSTGKHT